MKIWSVPSSMLDDDRLLRHHQSIHGTLLELLKKPTRKSHNIFYRHGGYLVLRHWEAVNEMRLRGMRHNSPVDHIWKQIPEARREVNFQYPKTVIVRDVKVLKLKQRNARKRSGTYGRIALTGIPDSLNRLAEECSIKGLPHDVFLI